MASTDTPAPIRLGNIFLIAASVARSILATDEREIGFPFVVQLAANGDMFAIAPGHPGYERAAIDPAKVCVADGAMNIERFAGRIRDAVAREART